MSIRERYGELFNKYYSTISKDNLNKLSFDISIFLIGALKLKEYLNLKNIDIFYERRFLEKIDKKVISSKINNFNSFNYDDKDSMCIFEIKILNLINSNSSVNFKINEWNKVWKNSINCEEIFQQPYIKKFIEDISHKSVTLENKNLVKIKNPIEIDIEKLSNKDKSLPRGTLTSLASKYNLSKERVRQIAKKNGFFAGDGSLIKAEEKIKNAQEVAKIIEKWTNNGWVLYNKLYLIHREGFVYKIIKSKGSIEKVKFIQRKITKGNPYIGVSVGIGNPVYLHRLIAEVFLPNPNNYDFVSFKDKNRLNFCVDNLEWIKNPSFKRTENSLINSEDTLLNFIIDNFEEALDLDAISEIITNLYIRKIESPSKQLFFAKRQAIKSIIKKFSQENENENYRLFEISKKINAVFINNEKINNLRKGKDNDKTL